MFEEDLTGKEVTVTRIGCPDVHCVVIAFDEAVGCSLAHKDNPESYALCYRTDMIMKKMYGEHKIHEVDDDKMMKFLYNSILKGTIEYDELTAIYNASPLQAAFGCIGGVPSSDTCAFSL